MDPLGELVEFVIIVSSGPLLMLAGVGTFGETDEKLAPKLDSTDNQCCNSISQRVV
jgi:hypothetical protein